MGDLDEDRIGKWVETKLLSFLETYLKIETHSQYQNDNFVICPECEMRLPLFEVAAVRTVAGAELRPVTRSGSWLVNTTNQSGVATTTRGTHL